MFTDTTRKSVSQGITVKVACGVPVNREPLDLSTERPIPIAQASVNRDTSVLLQALARIRCPAELHT
jgi:hypothetical protein